MVRSAQGLLYLGLQCSTINCFNNLVFDCAEMIDPVHAIAAELGVWERHLVFAGRRSTPINFELLNSEKLTTDVYRKYWAFFDREHICASCAGNARERNECEILQ